MDTFGPAIACESALANGASLDVVSAFTSLIPAFFGLGVLMYLVFFRYKDFVPYVMAVLLLMAGIGSVIWKLVGVNISFVLELLPGMFFFTALLFVWPATIKNNRWFGYGALAISFGLQFLISTLLSVYSIGSGFTAFFLVATIIGFMLVYLTRTVNPRAGVISGVMLLSAMLAAFTRMYDTAACALRPDTNFFAWHILLGFAGFMAVVLMIELRRAKL
jgi:hypothetical protein